MENIQNFYKLVEPILDYFIEGLGHYVDYQISRNFRTSMRYLFLFGIGTLRLETLATAIK